MSADSITRIVLIGFSGTGKSTVARLVADRLGWTPVDTDADIERETGLTVPEIFARDGEATFRAIERRHLLQALQRSQAVIATGGGAVIGSEVWTSDVLESPFTLVVALDAEPATILERLRAQHAAEGAAVERPMIAGNDPLARIVSLKRQRQAVYDRAAVTLIVDRAPASTIADEIVSLLPDPELLPSVVLEAPSGRSEIVIEPGALAHAGELVTARWPRTRRVWIVTDRNVAAAHGTEAESAFAAAGLAVSLHAVESGESSKSLATAGELYDWMLNGGIERGDVTVALGGGVVGDLAGFVAATVLRGVGLVQAPTSLLAMVDSSAGGKTGINHRAGKNLIGAFYQPPLVAIDPALLATLPPRERTSGWAEIVKHAVIQPSTPAGDRADLLGFLERNSKSLLAGREPATTYLIRRNVALKAAVVEADERETGIRAYLNFGHTLGHAIEASGYAYMHGEAVAVGMRAAMRIGERQGSVDATTVARIDALLDCFGLPATVEVDRADVLRRIGSDKKRTAGVQRWVLPVRAGGVAIRTDVPPDIVESALRAVSDESL